MLPATQSCYSVFTCPTQRVLISRWTPARCSRPDNLTFFCLYLSNTASLDLPLDAGEVLPARQSYFLCLYLSNTGVSISRWTPAGCSRPDKRSSVCSHQKISNPVKRDIPGRFGNLSFQSTTGEVRPPSSQVSISPQMPQEPPGWTTKLTHQTGGTPTSWMSAKHPDQTLPFRLHLSDAVSLDLPSDASEVLPARQPYLF